MLVSDSFPRCFSEECKGLGCGWEQTPGDNRWPLVYRNFVTLWKVLKSFFLSVTRHVEWLKSVGVNL